MRFSKSGNEAAYLAARKNKRIVTYQEFGRGKDKVMMGAEEDLW